MKQTIKYVSSWKELIELVEDINPYKYTIVLSGYFNQLEDDSLRIKSLVFTTVPSKILTEVEKENGYDITVNIQGKKK